MSYAGRVILDTCGEMVQSHEERTAGICTTAADGEKWGRNVWLTPASSPLVVSTSSELSVYCINFNLKLGRVVSWLHTCRVSRGGGRRKGGKTDTDLVCNSTCLWPTVTSVLEPRFTVSVHCPGIFGASLAVEQCSTAKEAPKIRGPEQLKAMPYVMARDCVEVKCRHA